VSLKLRIELAEGSLTRFNPGEPFYCAEMRQSGLSRRTATKLLSRTGVGVEKVTELVLARATTTRL
jgi:hypothetical protein